MNWKMKNYMALAGSISLLISAQNAWALSAVLVKDDATWSDPSAWVTAAVPGSSDSVFVREGYNVTVDSDVGSVSIMYIGDLSTYGSSGTVYIVDGGSLIASSTTQVGRQKDTGFGELNISGGYFQSGDSSGSSAMLIGVDTASDSTTGILEISGTGTFVGRAIIGSNEAGDTGDVFRIIGSNATVGNTSTAGANSIEVRSGTMEWVFDATGASTANFEEIVTFGPNSAGIVVDGAAYTGGDQTFTLLSAGILSSTEPPITLNNFEVGTTYSWNSTTDTLTIDVKSPIVRSLRFLLVK